VLDSSTGETRWNVSTTREVPVPVPSDPVSIRVAESVSPAVTDDRVFLTGWSQNTTLVAVNKSAQSVELNATVGRTERIVSSQIVAGEVLYVATENHVAAIDTDNGNVLWDERVQYPFPTLAVGRETLLFDEYSSLVALRNQSQGTTNQSVPSRRSSPAQLQSTGSKIVDENGVVAAGHRSVESVRWRQVGATPDSVGRRQQSAPTRPAGRSDRRCRDLHHDATRIPVVNCGVARRNDGILSVASPT
jgi:outer membrane protein assembly factor BamB